MGALLAGLVAGDPLAPCAIASPQLLSVAARSTMAARRFGIIASTVPRTTTMPPNQIHFTSGFR